MAYCSDNIGSGQAPSYFNMQDDGVYVYNKYKEGWHIMIKYPVELGDVFVDNMDDTLTVESLDQEITTQLGSFKAIKYVCEWRSENEVSQKRKYYVPGIGFVLRESVVLEGNGKERLYCLEELVKYRVD